MPVTKVHAREIFDSRGNPTVEVDLTTELGKLLHLFPIVNYIKRVEVYTPPLLCYLVYKTYEE